MVHQRIQQTLEQMVQDRGWTMDPPFTQHAFSDTELLFTAENESVHAYLVTKKMGINEYRKFIEAIKASERYTGTNCPVRHLILVITVSLSSDAKKAISKQHELEIEVFNDQELMYNVVRHELQPEFTLYRGGAEVANLVKRLGCKLHETQIMGVMDPVARYYGAHKGDMFATLRSDGLQNYRMVV